MPSRMRTATLLTRIALSGSRVGCHQLVKPTRGNNVVGDICGHQQLASQRVLPFRIIARQQTTLGSETKEESMRKALLSALDASFVDIEDISGGCGSMYKLVVESPQFHGKSLVNQHKLVTKVLEKEIGEMHGLTIQTRKTPKIT